MRVWSGDKPEACDLCKRPIADTFIDGKTVFGPWGILCPGCHEKHGVGLGTGKGQKFVRLAGSEDWIDSRDVLTFDAKNVPSESEIRKLIAERNGADFDHQPREPIGVEGEEDLPYIPE